MPKKTDTTERVFEYMKRYIEQNGKSPEPADIKAHFDFRSMGTVYYHIKRLERESRIEVGCIRGMKKFSDIKVKVAKMRNLDAFNAMSRDGQSTIISKFFLENIFDGTEIFIGETANVVSREWASKLIDWLYSPAE